MVNLAVSPMFCYVFDDNASEFQVFVHKMLYFNCDLAVTNHFRGFLKIQGKGKKTVFFILLKTTWFLEK